MKTLIVILIISSFLETTILPVHLTLIILISRAFIRSDKSNLYLAFSLGLLNGFLNINLLGITSIIYLILVQISQLLSKSRLSGNLIYIVPITFGLLSLNGILISLFNHQSLHLFPKVLFESLLSLPIFYLVKLWEERFIIRREIKLKL